MATKPATHTFTFATDSLFSSGPASGQNVKTAPAGWPSNLQGFVPGLEYAAEYRNYLFNKLGDWTGWLNAGSSAGAADAHIVEVDASGNTALREIDLVGPIGSVLWRDTTVDNATPPDLDSSQDTWFLKGTLVANQDVTLKHSSAGGNTVIPKAGQRLCVRMSFTGAFTVTFRNEAANALAATAGAAATDEAVWFEFNGTEWRPIMWTGGITGVVAF